jgi:hypothetical protein
MSLARQHRDRFANRAAAPSDAPAAIPVAEAGPPKLNTVAPPAELTLAQRRKLHQAGVSAATVATANEAAKTESTRSVDGVMSLRLIEDLRRLHDTRSIKTKIEIKRELLPSYAPYIEGLLEAAAEGKTPSGDILPTIMIWRMDTGDYAGALPLAKLVLQEALALPSRYDRDAPTLIIEEIANGAIEMQKKGERFDLELLEEIEELTSGYDVHDQVTAKLQRAIGDELLAKAEQIAPGADEQVAAYKAALAKLKAARDLDERVGVADKIKRAEKTLLAIDLPNETQAGPPAA